jgi:hypothetical protein
MQHVNDPAPSVLDRRGDVPPRLDLVVQRSLAKRPEDRHGSMEELVADLEASLRELDGYGDDSQRTLVVPAAARRARPHGPRRRRTATGKAPAVLIGLALLMLALAGAVYLLVDGAQNSDNDASDSTPPPPASVRMTALSAYDPEGDNREHPEAVTAATDGDPASYWTTESYRDFSKSGVGIVVESKPAAPLEKLTVTTDTPGFPARIRASNDDAGGFVDVSGEQTVGGTTTFDLDTQDKAFRYYLVWLRLPGGGSAHVNEVRPR